MRACGCSLLNSFMQRFQLRSSAGPFRWLLWTRAVSANATWWYCLAGGQPFRVFSVGERSRWDDSTPPRQRRVTGLVFRVPDPSGIWKGQGFVFSPFHEQRTDLHRSRPLKTRTRSGTKNHPPSKTAGVGHPQIQRQRLCHPPKAPTNRRPEPRHLRNSRPSVNTREHPPEPPRNCKLRFIPMRLRCHFIGHLHLLLRRRHIHQRLQHGIRVETDGINPELHQIPGELRVIAGSLSADADFL
jgi:hypothetical protein